MPGDRFLKNIPSKKSIASVFINVLSENGTFCNFLEQRRIYLNFYNLSLFMNVQFLSAGISGKTRNF